jgi:hypothetical protein
MMAIGPLEVLAVEFPGSKFTGELAPALRAIVDKGIIRVIDPAFITKDAQGTVTALELNDLDIETATIFDSIAAEVAGLLSLGIGHTASTIRPFRRNSGSIARMWVARRNSRFAVSERELPRSAAFAQEQS